jgi:hypothetical protein
MGSFSFLQFLCVALLRAVVQQDDLRRIHVEWWQSRAFLQVSR